MSTISWIIGLVSSSKWQIVLLGILTDIYFEWKSYRLLAHFNGPILGKFSNLWMFNVIGRKKTNLELYDVSEKLGTIFSL
jgi:hypothetical protein